MPSAPAVAPSIPAVPSKAAAALAGLGPLFAFTFLNSVGSAIVYSGIFFLAESRYGFDKQSNFALGTLYGIAYIPGAMGIGPLLRWLERRSARLTPRVVLGVIMVIMASLCIAPSIVAATEPGTLLPQDRPSWPIWLLVGIYSPLSGCLWPTIEGFLSGGRSGTALRSATGKFNIAWSSALVVTCLAISPFVDKYPLQLLLALATVHLTAIALLIPFPHRPAEHIHEHHAPPTANEKALLTLMRVLLPTAFLVLATVAPFLVTAREQLKLDNSLGTVLAATWMAARVVVFTLMERWHGWHGRWSVPLIGAGILLIAFAGLILAPSQLPTSSAVPVFVGSLLGFGVGVGIIYTAALYYAMHVGGAEVDAGGVHETLIGIGYTIGPACGLVACLLASQSIITPERVEPVMLAAVTLIALAGIASALVLASRRGSKVSNPN